MADTLTIIVHGESGVGKSHLADTSPAPRLILDVEGGVRFTPSKKVTWDPKLAPPEADGTWDACVVTVTDLDTIQRVFQWLNAGQHPFRSVVLDSLSEVQKRAIDTIAGTAQPSQQDFGTLKRRTEALVRAFRDLTLNPVKPVEVVVFVCGTAERGQEHAVMRPGLVGSITNEVGYYVDVMTYMSAQLGPDGAVERRALFVPVEHIAAKDRTGRLGVSMDNPSIPAMLERIYGSKEVA